MLQSIFRGVFRMVLVFAAALSFTACMKHAPVAPAPLLKVTAEDKKIIVAKVNGAEITNHALIDMMNRIRLMNERISLAESREAVRKKALDQLVLQELALQDAARHGVSVEEELVDRTMEQFISKLGHEEGYKEHLAENHITSVEFRAQVERSLIIQRILTEEVIKKIMVTDADMKNEYDRAKAEYLAPEKVSVVDIAVPLKQGEQAAMKKAQELLAAINADKDKDPSHLAHDDTYDIRSITLEKEKEPELFRAARKIKEGELSGVIPLRDGIHIIKLIAYTPERQKDFEEAKSSVEGKLKSAAFLKRRQEWERELNKDAKIEILNVPMQQERKKD
jgi:parvulin-like peptidyl-prolyl isomerase